MKVSIFGSGSGLCAWLRFSDGVGEVVTISYLLALGWELSFSDEGRFPSRAGVGQAAESELQMFAFALARVDRTRGFQGGPAHNATVLQAG